MSFEMSFDKQRTAEEIAAIKEARAVRLARSGEVEGRGEEGGKYLVVGLGEERFAVEIQSVETLYPLVHVTVLPNMPPHIAGVVVVMGSPVVLVNLGVLLGHRECALGTARIVLTRVDAALVAVQVDAVLGIERLKSLESYQRPQQQGGWLKSEYIKGVAPGGVLVIDLYKVLQDPRVVVGERAH